MAYKLGQKHFITGAATAPIVPQVDLKGTTVEITINGEFAERANGSAVMEGA